MDLTSVTWDWRKATGSKEVRWLAFNTSLDSGLLYGQLGQVRNNVDSANINLTGSLYQGLPNQTVTFNWYAGGEGSGDVDFDTPIVNGNVTVVPEPTVLCCPASVPSDSCFAAARVRVPWGRPATRWYVSPRRQTS